MWVREDENDEYHRRCLFRPCRLSRRRLTRWWCLDSSDSSELELDCDSSSDGADGDEGDDERDEDDEGSDEELGLRRDLRDRSTVLRAAPK